MIGLQMNFIGDDDDDGNTLIARVTTEYGKGMVSLSAVQTAVMSAIYIGM